MESTEHWCEWSWKQGGWPRPLSPAWLLTSVLCVPDTPASSCGTACSPVPVVTPTHQDNSPHQRGDPDICKRVRKFSSQGPDHTAHRLSRDFILFMGISVMINTGPRDQKFPSALLKMLGNVSAGR